MPSTESDSPGYHQKYRNLKRKLKVLIYENECFQEELKKAQRKLLKVARDKSFLLDRLLRYETVESSTSDSDATVSSDSETELKAEILAFKKKRSATSIETPETNCNNNNTNSTVPVDIKKKKSRKAVPVKPGSQQSNPSNLLIDAIPLNHGDGHMTSEEIERHLEAKQALRDLMPEKAPLTVPVEMFSNEPSGIDCEIHDGVPTNELSPNNVTEGDTHCEFKSTQRHLSA